MKNSILIFLFFLIACSKSTQPEVEPVLTYKTGLLHNLQDRYGKPYWRPRSLYGAIEDAAIPDTYDSREHGGQVVVKDQGDCGSCWAFGTVSTLEINHQVQTQTLIPGPLAPQEIVSCEAKYYGCGGGLFSGDFVAKYGMLLEKDYPYTASSSKCNKPKLSLTPAIKPHSFVYIGSPDRNPTFDEVTAAIAQYGAVAVSAGADGYWGQYHSGIFNKCKGTQVNHEITAMAYDRKNKNLTIQNSWGQSFGDHGYMTLPWGCDNLSEDAGYFVLDTAPCKPPKLYLPAEYIVVAGNEVTLAVKNLEGISYTWLINGKSVGTGSQYTFIPTATQDLSVIAKNSCGELEIKTLISIRQ